MVRTQFEEVEEAKHPDERLLTDGPTFKQWLKGLRHA